MSRARRLYLELHPLLQDVGSDCVVIITPPHTPTYPFYPTFAKSEYLHLSLGVSSGRTTYLSLLLGVVAGQVVLVAEVQYF